MKFSELSDLVTKTTDELGKQGIDVDKTNQYAIAGRIVFDLLVSQSIFLQITQDDNIFKLVKKAILAVENDILQSIIVGIYTDQTIWNTNRYSLADKRQISYQVLGYEYLHGGFDIMYATTVKVVARTFEKIQPQLNNVHEKIFEIGANDFAGKDEELLGLCDRLKITYSLLFFSLRSRSQLGSQVWQHAGVPLPSFLNPDKLSKQKRLMFNIGETVILLASYEYCYNSGMLESVDVASLSETSNAVNRADFWAQLHKIFQTRGLATSLFDALALQRPGRLSDNDKRQVFENVAFSFFISNFNPGKAFTEVFGQVVADYYKDGIENSIDYRYAVLSTLRKLGIDIDYQGEQGSDNYASSLVIDGRFDFRQSGQFKDEVKATLWKNVYFQTVNAIEDFFCGREASGSVEFLQLVVAKIGNLSIGSLAGLKKKMWILNSRSISRIGVEEYSRIFSSIKKLIVNPNDWNNLVAKLSLLNKDCYVCVGSKIYSYSDMLAVFAKNKTVDMLSPIQVQRANCVSLYGGVVNPSESFQMKMIDLDYRIVKYIEPLSYSVAKYAIDTCLDAFNQIALPSQAIKDYYQQVLAAIEEENTSGVLTSFDSQAKIIMFDSNRLLSEQLYELLASMKLRKAVFACGYCFKSGLNLLNKIIAKTVHENIPVQFVVGSLQKYRSCIEGEGTITGIDKATAQVLNQYLVKDNVQLYTCEKRFYHGKIYKFETDKETVVCIGSSNISRAAYASNYELNLGFIMPNTSELKRNFDLMIQRVIKSSALLDRLDESVFGDSEINMEGSAVIRKLTLTSVQRRINELTNEEVKYRLNLWMSYSPAVAAEDLGINSLPNYFVFVYPNKKLMVLESFSAGNAYFCIKYSDSFESELNKIASFSKTEIFQYSQMTKRGYHVTNKFTLENNIRRYFW